MKKVATSPKVSRPRSNWIDKLAAFAPVEWREEYEDVLRNQRPVSGLVQAPNGLVHEVIGNFTVCDLDWAYEDAWLQRTGKPHWLIVKNVGVTCFACLTDRTQLG